MKRRRGIRASNTKLTRAMLDAGLKTQAALADRIADLENLDAAPRDLISRTFRELPVEARSLERIALALGVEAQTLVKTSDEPDSFNVLDQPPEDSTHSDEEVQRVRGQTPGRSLLGIRWLMLAVLVLIIGYVGLSIVRPVHNDTPVATRQLTMGRPSVLILPTFGDADNVLSPELRKALQLTFNVTANTAVTTSPPYDLSALARQLRADLVVETEIVAENRLIGLRAFVFHNGVRQLFWSDSLPRVALPTLAAAVAEKTAFALRHYIGKETALPHFAVAAVQDDYLRGEFYLDQPASELNLKRAETRFEAAIRHDDDYARAHAGLCQALLESHWMLEEDRMLNDAKVACNRASALAPDDPVVKIAQAHFLQRTGRGDDAIALYQEIIARNPKYPSAYSGLGASWLEAYRQGNREGALSAATQANQQAADLDQNLWKPLFQLTVNHWFAGNIDDAIAASEAALARQENEFILGNLGSLYICVGRFERARTSYERALEVAPDSYIGREFLGWTYYLLGDYDEAIRLRLQAIESIGAGTPEIHEMWGELGDAYRQNGDTTNAVAAYLQAAQIAERDYVRGTIPVSDQASRAYYYTVLRYLDRSLVTDLVDREIAESLDGISEAQFEATGHRRMAQTWLLRGRTDRAIKSFEAASEKCPGYGQIPDLEPLAAHRADTAG